MAKIIVSCRFQKSAKDMADLIRYMASYQTARDSILPHRNSTILFFLW